ncbi:MAG: hypothetical protein AAGF30_03480 [Pseudomonadota bacterium]
MRPNHAAPGLLTGPCLALPATAETCSVTDDLGCILHLPADPQRIAVRHDKNLGTPPIELNMTPVGSHARETSDEVPFIPESMTVTGYDLDDPEVSDLGGNPAGVSAVVGASPGLIIASTSQHAAGAKRFMPAARTRS